MSEYKIDYRFWITYKGEAILGSGKIKLLQKTQELGSLRKAAEELKMSYRKAWYSINQVNKTAEKPVVILKRGGKAGGVAEITDYGKNLIDSFLKLQNEFDLFVEEKKSIFHSIL